MKYISTAPKLSMDNVCSNLNHQSTTNIDHCFPLKRTVLQGNIMTALGQADTFIHGCMEMDIDRMYALGISNIAFHGKTGIFVCVMKSAWLKCLWTWLNVSLI